MIVKKDHNTLVGKPYHPEQYHCWDFIEECLEVPSLQGIAVDVAKSNIDEYKPFFIERLEPVNYCLVLMNEHHIGIWKDGRVYHADRDAVKCENIRSIRRKYAKITYYDKG